MAGRKDDKPLPKLTKDEISAILSYDPDNGHFTWLDSASPKVRGKRAGSISHYGYVDIRIHTKHLYKAHRLAWALMTGEWPAEIDHINGVKDDNRICNLRAADRAQNTRNSTLRKHSQSRLKGVASYGCEGKFYAYIRINGRKTYLGSFDNPHAAHGAYCAAAIMHHGEFANFG
jgi:hypothetical protein